MPLEILLDAEALARRAAELFAAAAQEAAATRGAFTVALSGGETPRELYRIWRGRSAPPRSLGAACTCTGATSAACRPTTRAATTAWRATLSSGMCPSRRRTCTVCAARTSRSGGARLRERAARATGTGRGVGGSRARARPRAARSGRGRPHGLVVPAQPGAGGDGASGGAQRGPGHRPRLTVTLPVINAARRVWFLVSGAGKAGIVAEVLEGERMPAGNPGPGGGAGARRAHLAAGRGGRGRAQQRFAGLTPSRRRTV